ncbi:MAG: SH3 domain-containing protein [Acidobacteria bacterium]|nr:MAG: SH3 domain-containing protein [Acidobacteriota bacterium]REK02656.1 MAG: SH3 domain-containing protein [Acidobacteriota bacterium]REK13540.1 MAG: SH3 domain-containing protein [Acidobacteriota bacterium]REK41534.1 MAG: SH3 domain-containing protein [Acidobacteriota bacterium]
MPRNLNSAFLRARKILLLTLIGAIAAFSAGCGIVDSLTSSLLGAVGVIEQGTVISRRANIRSSYAVVAADVLEVKRGQQLEILDDLEFEGVVWYRVRASDEDQTEGWIEAQHVIKEDDLQKSRDLAAQDQALPPQATGQLRAMSNLRLTPTQHEDNILLLLESGASFEVVDWEYVPKDESEPDEEENEEIAAAGKEGDPEKLNEKYDMWYKVRLDPSVSPAPMGWVYGRQIELQVPSDIVYFQSNDRKFVTWLRLDDLPAAAPAASEKDQAARIQKPGSWVILSRTNEVKAIDGVEPDFDGIVVLGFDKYNEEHYTVFSTRRERYDVWGLLPAKMEGAGDNKVFTLRLRNKDTGEMADKAFEIYRDKNRRLRINTPEDIETYTFRENRRR